MTIVGVIILSGLNNKSLWFQKDCPKAERRKPTTTTTGKSDFVRRAFLPSTINGITPTNESEDER